MAECPLRRTFFEIRSKMCDILDSTEPKFSKSIPGIYTVGQEENVEPSDENPAVVVVRVHQDDRQRAGKVHDRLVRLIQSSFPHTRPPFRWIVHETVPYYDNLPSPTRRGHQHESSQQCDHDPIGTPRQDTWSHNPPVNVGASLGTIDDLTGAGSVGCFVCLENDLSTDILTCHHNLKECAGNSVEERHQHQKSLTSDENTIFAVTAHCITQSTLQKRLKDAEDEFWRCKYDVFNFEYAGHEDDMPQSLARIRGWKTKRVREEEIDATKKEIRLTFQASKPEDCPLPYVLLR